MYRRILVALNSTPADENLLDHVTRLATRLQSELLLLHVADGWAARYYDDLKLAESEEMRLDRDYLETTATRLRAAGLPVQTLLARGNPPAEILKAAASQQCDLIAMATHGHRLFGDLLYGSTIAEVRHRTTVPVLLVRAGKT